MAASFAGKPSSGGTPAIDSPAKTMTQNATGIEVRSPDRERRSRLPVRMSISPTAMKRAALNTAWATTSETAAKMAFPLPSDIMAVIRPSWLTVPQASTSLASAWRRAPLAPQNIVSRPTVTPRPDQMSTAPSTGCITPIKTMPAFTMVAECR